MMLWIKGLLLVMYNMVSIYMPLETHLVSQHDNKLAFMYTLPVLHLHNQSNLLANHSTKQLTVTFNVLSSSGNCRLLVITVGSDFALNIVPTANSVHSAVCNMGIVDVAYRSTSIRFKRSGEFFKSSEIGGKGSSGGSVVVGGCCCFRYCWIGSTLCEWDNWRREWSAQCWRSESWSKAKERCT